jgi:hypothetical protein
MQECDSGLIQGLSLLVPVGAEEGHEKCQESGSTHRDFNPIYLPSMKQV